MDTTNFFYRNAIFSKAGDKISLIDLYNPSKKETLEPWLGLILQLADGQHTIDELYHHLARKYPNSSPENLNKTINSVINRLVSVKFIVLTKESVDLPYYLSLPYELLDVVKAKKLLEQDQNLKNNS